MQHYKDHIKELEEHIVPTNPPEIIPEREQDVISSAESIALNIHRLTQLLEKSAQLWTQLLEHGSLQELQGKEDKLHTSMEDIKQQ
jgi:hypothetical protein